MRNHTIGHMIKEGNERVKQEKNAKRIELFPHLIDDRKYWTNRELRTFVGQFNCPTCVPLQEYSCIPKIRQGERIST